MNPLDTFEDDLTRSLGSLSNQTEPDRFTLAETSDLDRQQKKVVILGQTQNLKERKKYAKYIFIMLCIWLFLMLTIIVLSGLPRVPFTCMKFELSETVLITLITTTTANVAAFFLVVTKNLFPTRVEKNDE